MAPALLVQLLERAARNVARVVHQDVEPAQLARDVGEQALDIGEPGDVGFRLADVRQLGLAALQSLLIHVADVRARAVRDEAARDGEADAGRARGDDDPQSLG